MAYVDDRQIWDDLSPSMYPWKVEGIQVICIIFIHWLKIGCQMDHDIDHVSLVFVGFGEATLGVPTHPLTHRAIF